MNEDEMVSWIIGGSTALAVIGAAALVLRLVGMVADEDFFDEFSRGAT